MFCFIVTNYLKTNRNDFVNLTGKPTGKRLLERSGCGWEVNIGMDLKEIDVNGKNRVDSA